MLVWVNFHLPWRHVSMSRHLDPTILLQLQNLYKDKIRDHASDECSWHGTAKHRLPTAMGSPLYTHRAWTLTYLHTHDVQKIRMWSEYVICTYRVYVPTTSILYAHAYTISYVSILASGTQIRTKQNKIYTQSQTQGQRSCISYNFNFTASSIIWFFS